MKRRFVYKKTEASSEDRLKGEGEMDIWLEALMFIGVAIALGWLVIDWAMRQEEEIKRWRDHG